MKFIDFFSGIGGFRSGLEQAGFECVGHCEIDKYADNSYRAMHDVKEDEWYAADIRNVRPEELPDTDIWCGGFPCQAFSVAGKRGGFEDTRGTLIYEVFRLAAVKKPKILFLENVKGLLNHDKGRTFGVILSALGELGYDVEWELLNSKNFGIPQSRERVFIIGHLGGSGGRKVFPLGRSGEKTLENDIKQLVGSPHQGQRIYDPSGISTTLVTMKIGMSLFAIVDKKGNPTAQDRHGVMLSDPCFINQPKYGKYRLSKVADTLTSTGKSSIQHALVERTKVVKNPSLNDDGTITAIDAHYYKGHGTRGNKMRALAVDGYRIRRLTPKECFRLQGFPDELFEKARMVNSDSQLYKQAGNAVTVNVIRAIGERLKEVMN